ncbi:putative F-box protein At1g33530 [Papaver somniferum]|uniref:putative F-box protein At1g33530 n=1 Tax=Papaver somniferum TaxID=3469 RepID=UPI000E6FC098|nr:putative F-box protein At1g33530 [Papaver somniferum]
MADNAFHKLGTIQSGCKRKLIGFCHGLVCLYRVKEELIEVCNPSRREILVIHAPRPTKRIKSYGFGFDSAMKQYKVVFVFDVFVCMVFTLGGNSPSWRWREIPFTNVDDELQSRLLAFECPAKTKKSAVLCNGALYWKKQNSKPSELVMYDIHEERFQIIQVPDEFVEPYQLFEYGGSLCAARMEKFGKKKCNVHPQRLTKEKYDDGEHQMVWTGEPPFILADFKKELELPPLKDLNGKQGARIVTVQDQILLH